MTTTSPANIFYALFDPAFRIPSLARAIGSKKSAFDKWARGERTMPADKRRQLADIIESRNLPSPVEIAAQLRYEADLLDYAPRDKGGNLKRAWRKNKAAGKPALRVKHPVNPAKL